MDQGQGKYTVVEGVLGVGKTSLCEFLAREMNARLIAENVEDNPFLAKFYKDMRAYAFQAQMFFLLSRFRQQQELQQQDLFSRNIISDFLFAKDRIFANITLDENELVLYDRLYNIFKEKVLKPDLVIYLQSSTEILLQRIRRRGRPYEKDISPEYIDSLNQAYNYFFFHYNETPLLVVNTTDIDFVRRSQDLTDLIKHIREMKKGTFYYTPSGLSEKSK